METKCELCDSPAVEGKYFCAEHLAEEEEYWALEADWKRYDTQDHLAAADYYEGVLAGQQD